VDANFRFYSVPEAAAELQLTDGRIRQLLLAGEMLGHKLGGEDGKNWVIPEASLKRFKAAREKKRQATNRNPSKI